MPIRVNAAKSVVDFVKNNAAKTEADFVKVNAAKTIAYQKSSPQFITIEMAVGTGWSNTWQSNGPDSSGGNRNQLAYAGIDGWNSQNETSMMGIDDLAAVVAALQARPVAVGDGSMKIWSGYKRSTAAGDLWVGWHTSASPPSTLPAPFHGETDLTYATPVPWTRPGATGALNQAVVPQARVQNIIDAIAAGTFKGIRCSSEAGNINANWGWFAGTSRSTTNSGGVSGGLVGISSGEQYVARLEITTDL